METLNLNILRDEGRMELVELLESLRGKKCLVVDYQLGEVLNQIILEGTKLLKDNGVSQMKDIRGVLDFSSSESSSTKDVPDNIVYLVRPELGTMKMVAKQVKACMASGE